MVDMKERYEKEIQELKQRLDGEKEEMADMRAKHEVVTKRIETLERGK